MNGLEDCAELISFSVLAVNMFLYIYLIFMYRFCLIMAYYVVCWWLMLSIIILFIHICEACYSIRSSLTTQPRHIKLRWKILSYFNP